jgi:hypothetical protein
MTSYDERGIRRREGGWQGVTHAQLQARETDASSPTNQQQQASLPRTLRMNSKHSQPITTGTAINGTAPQVNTAFCGEGIDFPCGSHLWGEQPA